MAQKKLSLGVFCGGKSAEHEVSLNSAVNIIKALDQERYDLTLIAIDKNGFWHLLPSLAELEKAAQAGKLAFAHDNSTVSFLNTKNGTYVFDLTANRAIKAIDLAFPVLHGPYGEDGTLQGFFKTIGLPFVGSGVLGSAVGMDKDVMKRLFRDAGLPIGRFMVIRSEDRAKTSFKDVSSKLGVPFFIKPANMGSSIGVHKVTSESEWQKAIQDAFLYDHKILVEEMIDGREIECSVLGNQHPKASFAGEVIAHHEFYSYEAKYIDKEGASIKIPADLPKPVMEKVQQIAIEAFRVLCCEGLARVDFFVKSNGEVLLNEINTLPGFTQISMYPKMWEASGLSYSKLLDQVIELALEKHQRDRNLQVSFTVGR